MGIGDPLEAAYTLSGPVNSGKWHLVGDGIVLVDSVDVQFDVIWRSGQGTMADTTIATFAHHFDRPTGDAQFNAVAFDGDAQGVAATAKSGDQLVLRFTATQASAMGAAFIPNGDGAHTNGRIPSLTLP